MMINLTNMLGRVESWAKLISSLGGVVTVLWGTLMLFSPIGKTDLTVRIEREIPISLPAGVPSLPLRLVHEGRDITRASLVQLEILNSGSLPIGEPVKVGEPEKRWKLDLRSRDGVTLVPLGNIRRKPANIKVDVVKGTSPDIVSLHVGLLNPKDTIGLELLLIQPKEVTTLPIFAETRVPGLSQPETGRRNVQERLQDAFFAPLWIVGFLGLFGWAMYERVRLKRLGKRLAFADTIPGGILMSYFGASILAAGFSWALAWLAANVLSK